MEGVEQDLLRDHVTCRTWHGSALGAGMRGSKQCHLYVWSMEEKREERVAENVDCVVEVDAISEEEKWQCWGCRWRRTGGEEEKEMVLV